MGYQLSWEEFEIVSNPSMAASLYTIKQKVDEKFELH